MTRSIPFSSNHNQHLHSIIENYNEYPIDIIVFYGGYNETFQTALYDPRPGYPYNFQVRNEMSPEEMFLRKHFVIYTIVEKLFNKFPLKPFTFKPQAIFWYIAFGNGFGF